MTVAKTAMPARPTTRIQTVVVATVLAAVTMLIAIGFVGAAQYRTLLERQTDAFEASATRVEFLNAARLAFGRQAQDWQNLLLLGHVESEYHRYLKRFYESERQAIKAIEALRTHLRAEPTHANRDLVNDLEGFRVEQKNVAIRYRSALHAYNASDANPRKAANETVGRIDRAALLLLNKIANDLERWQRDEIAAQAREIAFAESGFLVLALSIAVSSCILLFWFLDRMFTQPVANAVAAAGRIARNDLETAVHIGRGDGIGGLTSALETMRKNLLSYRERMANALHQAETARINLDARVRERSEALVQSEERYRLTFEQAAVGVAHISVSGECLQVNDRFCQILGYKAQTLRGMQLHQLSLPADLQSENAALNALRKGTLETLSSEKRMVREDGALIWVSQTVSLIRDAKGAPQRYIFVVEDISKRREAEESALMARQEAEFANRSKSTFLANMSHELRTPLNAVIGYSQMLSGQMFGKIENPKYVEYAEIITHSGQHLLELINDVLDVSKIEAGELELEESEVEPETLIEECVTIMRERAESGTLSLTPETRGPTPPVRADRLRMKQVILNLLSNAIKFTPPFGKISVSAETTERGLEIHVRDTGGGIAEEDIPRILEPFGQARNSLTSSQEGTGLGLPLVNSLMALHGGTLEIDSAVGRGTTVTVTLPPERFIAGAAGTAATVIPLRARK